MVDSLYEMESVLRARTDKFQGDLKKGERMAKGATSKINNVLGAVGIGLAVAGGFRFLKSAGREAVAFEKQLAGVSTMLDTTTMSRMPEYAKALTSLSIQYGQTTETLSKGLYDVLSAGIAADSALGVLEVGAQAAVGGMTDTATAIDALTSILNAYKIDAQDADKVSDMLFATVKRGKTTFSELARFIGMIAPTAAQAGVTLDELGAALSTVTRAGIRTTTATAGLNALLMTIIKPAAESIKASKEQGIAWDAATLKAKGLRFMLGQLADASTELRAKIVPSAEALRALNGLMGDMEGFDIDLSVQAGKAGSTGDAYTKMADTVATDLSQVEESFNALRVAVGNTFTQLVSENKGKILELTDFWRREVEKLNPRDTSGTSNLGIGIQGFANDAKRVIKREAERRRHFIAERDLPTRGANAIFVRRREKELHLKRMADIDAEHATTETELVPIPVRKPGVRAASRASAAIQQRAVSNRAQLLSARSAGEALGGQGFKATDIELLRGNPRMAGNVQDSFNAAQSRAAGFAGKAQLNLDHMNDLEQQFATRVGKLPAMTNDELQRFAGNFLNENGFSGDVRRGAANLTGSVEGKMMSARAARVQTVEDNTFKELVGFVKEVVTILKGGHELQKQTLETDARGANQS